MKKNKLQPSDQNSEKIAERKALMGRLLLHCVLILAIYYVLVYLKFEYIFHIYVAVGVCIGAYYVIYNRGFVGKNLTPEMLPDTMTAAQKQAFIEDCQARMKKSRWALTVLIPIILTIAVDMFYLFVIQGMFA